MTRVYLGGTFNGSEWRTQVTSSLKIDYYSPIIEDGDEDVDDVHFEERKMCDYFLYVFTPKMIGAYALSQITNDLYKRPQRTMFCFLPEEQDQRLTATQIKDLELLGQKVESQGGLWCHTLDDAIKFLNTTKKLQNISAGESASPRYYDVFISYGRQHSKNFATRLHNRLSQMGYRVWFDQNDIPFGVDFQKQINEGISRSHNFIFVISPHAVRSPYCLKEIHLAVSLNKRIIPLLHLKPTDEEMAGTHPIVGKLNWIYFQEKVDRFDDSFKHLTNLLQSHLEYVHRHTSILRRALEWEKNQKASIYLLTGRERVEAETWLTTDFQNEPAPCLPNDLHCEYICESKKLAEGGATDVFMCYARESAPMRDRIRFSLMRHGLTVWMDDKDIKTGMTFEEAIRHGIERADAFLFLLSPDSIKSPYCLMEMNHALQMHKRIIPLLVEPTDVERIPKEISSLQWIDLTAHDENTYQRLLLDLIAEIANDKEFFYLHKTLLIRALQWESRQRIPSFLLRGYPQEKAEAWLKIGKSRKLYGPVALQEELIAESRTKAAHLETDVFIACSPIDLDLVQRLNIALNVHGKVVWLDQDIISGNATSEELDHCIEQSENFLFVATSESIQSDQCLRELDTAARFHKRILVAQYPGIMAENFPAGFQNVPVINFQNDHDSAFSDLLRSLDVDRDHVANHTKWLQKANEWEKHNCDDDHLLRGSEFTIAQEWLRVAMEKDKFPQPSDLQLDFIVASKVGIDAEYVQELRRAKLKQIMLIVMSVLAVVAFIFGVYAFAQRKEAINQKGVAEINARKAETSAMEAQRNAGIAETNARIAVQNAAAADANAKEAKDNALRAEDNAKKARIAERQARTSEKSAQDARQLAEQNAKIARENEEKAKLAKEQIEALFLLAESKTLAKKSLEVLKDGDPQISTDLALHAFYLNQDYDGPTQNQSIYAALLQNLTIHDQESTMQKFSHATAIRDVDFHPFQQSLVAGDNSGYLQIWQTTQGTANPLQKKILTSAPVRHVTFSPDGQAIFIGGADGSLSQVGFSIAKDAIPQVIADYNQEIFELQFSGDILLAACADSVTLFRFQDSQLTLLAGLGKQKLTAAALTQSTEKEPFLAVAVDNKKLHFYRLNADQSALRLDQEVPFGRKVSALAFSPSGELLAIGTSTGYIEVWKTADMTVMATFSTHKFVITQLAFNHAGTKLASSSLDGSAQVRLFGKKDLNEPLLLESKPWVWGLNFSPDDRTLVTVGEDKQIHFWATDMLQLAERLCPHAHKKLSQDDMRLYTPASIIYRNKNCVSFD